MKKRDLFGSIIVLVGLFLLFSYWLDYVNVEAAGEEIPIYVILKEPILVDLEVCKDGHCDPKGDVGMIYKIRAGTTNITNHGMVNIIPYHKEARELLGDHLRIPMYNIRCIVTGDNKIKGHMWE